MIPLARAGVFETMKCRLPGVPFTVVATSAILAPSAGMAYVGPGAGLSMIGSLVAVLAAILIALFGLVFLPITILRRKRRAVRQETSRGGPPEQPESAEPPNR